MKYNVQFHILLVVLALFSCNIDNEQNVNCTSADIDENIIQSFDEMFLLGNQKITLSKLEATIDSLENMNFCYSNTKAHSLILDLEYRLLQKTQNEKRYLNYLNKNLKNLLRLKNPNFELLANLYMRRGDWFYQKKMYQIAYLDILKSKDYLDKISDTCFIAYFHYRMGMIHFFQQYYTESRNEFMKSLELYSSQCLEQNICKTRVQEIYNNIALTYQNEKNYDSSIVYLRKGLNFIKNIKKESQPEIDYYKNGEKNMYLNLFATFKNLDLQDSMIVYLENAANIVTEKDDYQINDELEVDFLEWYLIKNDFESFKTANERLKKRLNTLNKNLNIRYLKINRDYYEKINDWKLALQFHKQLDDLLNELNRERELVIRNNFDLYETIYQNQLKYEIEARENKSRQSRLQLLAIFSVLLLISIAIIVLIYIKSLKKSKNLIQLNHELSTVIKSLNDANKKLDHLNKQKNDFLSITAHDLRNPISAIYSITELIDNKISQEELEYFISLIKKSSENALVLINQIMKSAKDNNNSIQIEKSEFYTIVEIVKEVTSVIRFKAQDKKQEIIEEITNPTDTIFVDKMLFNRVLTNILSNAIKYSNPNQKIKIKTYSKETKAYFEIIDEGIGIPKELQSEIFKLNSNKIGRVGTSGEETFGWGLHISKQIVEAHNGKIYFISEEQKGTTFTIEIPIAEENSMAN